MRTQNFASKPGSLPAWSVLFSLLVAAAPTQAATPVSGTISEQTWTTANSPYVVTGDITVGTLTIQPGVTVQFAGNYGFSVGNRLTAIGTADARIVFTPQNVNIGWKGISFEFAGSASEIAFCTVQGANMSGIRVRSSQPIIRDCTIANNSSSGNPSQGGGIWTDSPLTLSRCVIENNILKNTPQAAGAGIYAVASLTLQNCTIAANQITVGPIGFGESTAVGGGVFCSTDLTINNSQVIGNTVAAPNQLGSAAGGGIFTIQLFATNSIIVRNKSHGDNQSGGAGIATVSGRAVNCTVADNTTTGRVKLVAGGLSAGTDPLNPVSVVNCIFWQNAPIEIDGRAVVSYSDVRGNFTGTGNFSLNPLFAGTDDFHIIADSPCIDAGNPAAIYNDACFPPSFGSTRNDVGAGGGPRACGFQSAATPVISTQPRSQSACLGTRVEFSVVAAGGEPLHYQWYFNQTLIPGQTDAKLSIPVLQASMAGSYTVRVSNNAGNITSEAAFLTINDACLDLQMYAGLTLFGVSGATYVISYTTDVGQTRTWTPLATNTLSGTEWFFVDRNSPGSPKRFYRAVRQ